MIRYYTLYGLIVASDLALPELPEVEAARADAKVIVTAVSKDSCATSSLYRFDVPDVARFEIRDGNTIAVDAAEGADYAQVRLFLLGSAMAGLLHQRGMLALHANAVVVNGCAFAFMGRSGVGKSTLAAWFAGQQCAILSDDVCVVRKRSDGSFEALPGVPRIRLFADSADAHHIETADLPLISFPDGWRKHVVALPSVGRPVPLRAIYLLDLEADAPCRLGPLDAFEALSANSYRGEMISTLGQPEAHYADLLSLVGSVPVFRATRGKRLRDSHANEVLLRHARQLSEKGVIPHASE